MKIQFYLYIILFSVLFSFSQVVTARYDNGEKKIVCDIDGQGIDERIITRYHFSKEGALILTEDFLFMDSTVTQDEIEKLDTNIWEIKIFDYNDIYLDIVELDIENSDISDFIDSRQNFPRKFYINDSVFYSIDLNQECMVDTIIDFSNNQINLMDSVNSIDYSYQFLSQENILLTYNDVKTYYGRSRVQDSSDIDKCLYDKKMNKFRESISGKWYSYDGVSDLDFNQYNVQYLDSGYVLLMGDSVKVSYFDGDNPSIYFAKDGNDYTFYRKTFNEISYEDTMKVENKVEIENNTETKKETSKRSSWFQGAISVLIIIFVIAQTIGG